MSQQPNVIVFFTDQQRWDTTGVHGSPLDLTPNFDRLARAGTDVHYAVTCQPVCGPARSCLQTGLYATTTGCYRNGIALPAESRTLAHYFGEAGYDTGYIGKWHLADQGPGAVPDEQRGGYDYWLAANALEFTSDAFDTVMYDNDNQPVKLPGYRVDAVTDAAICYVDDHQESPFFLFISYIEPHHQNHRDDYPAPPGYETRYRGSWMPPDLAALGGSSHQQWAGYCGMIKRLDEALGRLVDALISLDKLDDTIILFTSDHGNHFKTRNAEYKRSCHDASVRLPTLLHGGAFTGGGRIAQMVSLVDLPPTLLDAAGIPVPSCRCWLEMTKTGKTKPSSKSANRMSGAPSAASAGNMPSARHTAAERSTPTATAMSNRSCTTCWPTRKSWTIGLAVPRTVKSPMCCVGG